MMTIGKNTKYYLFGVTLVILIILLLSVCDDEPSDEYVVRVDDLKLTREALYRNTPPEYLNNISEEQKRRYIEDWIQEAIFYKEALKLDLDKKPEVMQKIEEAQWQIIVEAFIEDQIRSKIEITETDVQNYYDTHQEEYFRLEDEWRASHILVSTQEKAGSIINELTQDIRFESLAQEKSEDPSAEAGGDLGYFTRDEILPELAEVLTSMEVGQISEIIQTEFGYHLLKLTDFQPKGTVKSLDEVKDEIKNMLFMEEYILKTKSLSDSLKREYMVDTNWELMDSL